MIKSKKKPRNIFERAEHRRLKRLKVSFEYESDKIAYVLAGHYTPDFTIKTPTGKIYVELKGYFRPADKSKLRAVKRCNPKYDIRIVFYREVRSYVKWCEKYGFKYAIEKIPKEWLEGL